jgi:hypothetical protein
LSREFGFAVNLKLKWETISSPVNQIKEFRTRTFRF